MGKQGSTKRVPKAGQSGKRKGVQKRHELPKKAATRASDVYEAEDRDPAEELEAGRRYDRVDNYEYELPSDFEDEEIDEDTAFTEADKKQFADWFADEPEGEGEQSVEEANEADLLASESEDEEEEELNPDDFSEDEFMELTAARKATASSVGADAAPAAASARSDLSSDTEEDAADSDEDQPEDPAVEAARHAAMLAEVRGSAGNRKRKRMVVASEAYPDSEHNLPPTSSAGQQGELSISDLLRGLGDAKAKMGPARKALQKLARQEGPLAAPLPGPIRERQERKAGYETTKEDITKWQPLVKANREAPTLEFKSGRDDVVRSNTTAALAAKFAPENDMEEEVAQLLRAAGAHSGEAVEEAEEALALQALTVEEAKERRERLAKMRSLLFAHEQKAKRLKAIKSKGFHRHAKKAAKMKATKAGEAGDEEFIRLAAEDAELARAKERLTLKHRNSSRWARRALKRGMDVMDEGTKAAVAEQLRLGEELRRKVDRMDDKSGSESDSDASTLASDEEADDDERKPRKRAASAKTKAAALDILQGTGEEEEGAKLKTGLFSLPFMARAAERQRQQAQQEAAAVLQQLEAEDAAAAAGSDADLEADDSSAWGTGNSGRLSFGASPSFRQMEPDHSSDSGASSGDDEEDAEAKAARQGRRSKAAKSSAETDAVRQASRQARAQSKKKNSKKRPRDADMAEDDGSFDPEAAAGGKVFVSDGPLAVANRESERPLIGSQAQPRSTGQPSSSQPASALRHSSSALHDRAFGRQLPAGQPTTSTPPQAAADVHIGPVTAAETRSQQQQLQQERQPKFVKAKHFDGAKAGYVFKKGGKGVGYYLDPSSSGGVSIVGQQPVESNRQMPAAATESQDVPGTVDESVTRQDDAEDMRPISGTEMSQAELIKRAFAGDDVQADFEASKAAEVEEELPKQDAVTVLPGWGTWADQQKEPHWMKTANQKAERQKEAAAANRKDAKLKAVVISEAWDKKASKYNAPSVPFPYDSKSTYERSMRTPMGREFNTTATHRDMTRPAVIKHSGMIIDPIKFNKSAADSANQGKDRKMKVSVSSGIPRPSRR